jgi:hypothetical protein
MQEEERYWSLENKAMCPRRLRMSNIAADAGMEDIEEFFRGMTIMM